ncbi:MAG: hypothetical protein Q3968_03400 [Clostridiaceae bacterium]|nr:hypothetical protein [Clostridiaceae bacterium]
MAKKEKLPLTPEQLAAKNERKAQKRKLFGTTFLKALAVMLSILLVYSIVYIAFGQGTTIVQKVVSNGSSSQGGGSSSGGSSYSGGSSSNNGGSSSNSGGTAAPVDNGGSSDNGGAAAANDPASVAALINKVTGEAVAAKAGYDWERHCTVDNIDVGSFTGLLNGIIHVVDENADLNSVVGGFLGRGDKSAKVPQGQTLETIQVPKDDGSMENVYHASSYTLKASNLQAGDITNLQVNGDTYEFDLVDSNNPDRSGNTAFSRFCNDIVVVDEVNKEIQEQVGDKVSVNSLDASYHNIHVKAVISDGKLKELSYSMKADAQLGLKAGVSIKGSGNLDANAKYSNITY